MTRALVSPLCKICGDKSDAVHFGARSCRACAAFFRRRVVSRKSISAGNCEGDCSIENEVSRKLCGSCRYEKCLTVGMKTSAVLAKPVVRCKLESSSLSLLEQMKVAYGRLENSRRDVFRKKDHVPSASNYKALNKMLSIDMDLIRQHMFEFFVSITKTIAEDQRQLLGDHFVKCYTILDGAFRSAESNVFLMLNMDFVDLRKLDIFYRNPDEEDDTNAWHVTRVVEQYWWYVKRVLNRHLTEVKLDVQELLYLSALLFWDFDELINKYITFSFTIHSGIPGQSDECIEVCHHMRSRILEELTSYEKSKSSSSNYPLRVAEIIIVLQSVQKVLHMIYETKYLFMVYNMYGRECPIY